MAGTWGVEGTTATYKNEAGKVVAKITGLKSGVTATTVTNQIRVTEGEGGTAGTLTLNKAVLGTDTKTPVKLTLSNGGNYVLALDEDTVSGVSITDIALDYSVSKKVGKATVKGNMTAGYALSSNAKSVTYSAAATNQVLATVSNLSGDLKLSEGKLVREVTTTDDTTGEEITTTETAVTLVGDKVTLTDYALNAKKVTLAKGKVDTYTLALDNVDAPVTSETAWTYNSGKATLKGTVEEAGYTLSVDSKTLTYTAAGTSKKLAEISGLSSSEDLTLKDDGEDGVVYDANNNATIIVPTTALKQTNVTVSGAGYLLALDDDAVTESEATNKNIWAVKDKTNAIYKTIKPEHYDYDATKNTIVYTKQADVKTLATVKNLKSGIKAEDGKIEGIVLGTVEDEIFTASEPDESGNVIQLSAAVLNKGATLVNGTDESYKLALDNDVTAPATSDLKWDKPSGTTAVLKGKVTAGHTQTSDTVISYTAASNKATIATVKGIVKNLAVSEDGLSVGKNTDEGFENALTVSSDVIKVFDTALTSSNVTLTNGAGSYKLELDDEVTKAPETKTFWDTTSTVGKAKLTKGTDKYYTLDETTKTTITYEPAATGDKVATVEGLKSDLKPDDDGQIEGIGVGTFESSDFTSDDTVTTIWIYSKDVLNQEEVTVTNEGKNNYTLNVPDDFATAQDTTGWKTSSDTDSAVLFNYKSEYYSGSGSKKLTYKGQQQGAQIATITGVKSGLTVNSDGTIDGITIGKYEVDEDDKRTLVADSESKTIYIGPKILDKKDVTITNASGNEYELAITDDVKGSTVNGKWTISSKKPVYTLTTTEGYKANEAGNIEYLSKGTVKTTLSGLKNFASSDVLDGKIDGLAVGNVTDETFTESETGNVIQISSEDILNAKNVTLSTSGKGDYTFDLDSDVTEYKLKDGSELVWESNEKGTAELKGIIKTGGYNVSGDGKTVAYMEASDTSGDGDDYKTLAKITGLKSGLTADNLAEGTSQTGSVITLSNDVLGTSKVSVTGGVYTLAVDSDVPTKDDETSWKNKTKWVTSGTTATYKTHNAGYFTPSANGTTLNYTKATAGTTHATITGLASGTEITTSDTTITLTPDMLTNKSVTLTNKTGYSFKLALDGSVPTSTNSSLWKGITEWVTSGTTATYKAYNKAYYTLNGSGTSVGYTKESTPIQTFATVSGIAKGVDITDCFTSTGTETGIITLGLDQLAGKKVTLKNVGNTEFVLALSEDIPKYDNSETKVYPDPDDETKTIDENPNSVRAISLGNSWTKKSSTAANYVETTSKGYSLSSDAKTINYATKSANTTLATLSGLTKNFDVSNLGGITVTAPTASTAGTIVLTSDAIGESTKLTLGSKDNYVFAFDPDSTDVTESTAVETSWEIKQSKGKPTGVVTYQTTPEKGYNISTDGKTFTAANTDKATVLATISGLNKDALADMEDNAVGESIVVSETVDSTDKKYTLTISDPALLTKKVTLDKKDNYKFALDNITTDEDEAEEKILVSSTFTTPKWYVKSGTATYKTGTTEGYKVSSDGMTISYASEAAGDTVLTISGLNKNVAVSNDHSKIGIKENTPDLSDETKTIKDVVTSAITVTDSLNEVALTSAVLGTKTVTLTNGEGKTYKFSDEGFDKSTTSALKWSVSNGTATYSSTTSEGFVLEEDKTTLTYTKATSNTAATITGLNKEWAGDVDDVINTNGTDIVINAALLAKSNVTLKIPKGGTAYSLSLATDVPTATNLTDSWKNQTEWVTSGTTATYKTYDKAYYTIASATSVKYNAPTKGETHVTVSGIKKDVDITDCVNESTGVVTLGKDQLNKKTVSLTNKEGYSYTLALKTDDEDIADGGVREHVVQDVATWVEKTSKGKTTATLTGTLPAGYTVSDTKLTYAKASTQALATIAGISTGALDGDKVTLSAISGTINVDNSVGDNVTIDGKSTYAFNLANDYEGTITGAATADTITARLDSSSAVINSGKGNDVITITDGYVNAGEGNDTVNASGDVSILGGAGADFINITGGNVTVTGGAGPDTITSGGGGDNIFCYGDSDGADVIVDFKIATDKLQVTSKTTPKYSTSGSDAVVKVKNSTITLTGLASAIDDINIYNKDGDIIHGKDFVDEGSANVLLADDNYSTDAAQLSSIVEPFKATYTPYDFDTTLSLTKEENFTPEITYSKDNK